MLRQKTLENFSRSIHLRISSVGPPLIKVFNIHFFDESPPKCIFLIESLPLVNERLCKDPLMISQRFYHDRRPSDDRRTSMNRRENLLKVYSPKNIFQIPSIDKGPSKSLPLIENRRKVFQWTFFGWKTSLPLVQWSYSNKDFLASPLLETLLKDDVPKSFLSLNAF